MDQPTRPREPNRYRILPPLSAARVRSIIERGNAGFKESGAELLQQFGKQDLSLDELKDRLKGRAILWAFEIFTSVLDEWASVGIRVEEFDAMIEQNMTELACFADTWFERATSEIGIEKDFLGSAVRTFLADTADGFRKNNRVIFHALRAPVLDIGKGDAQHPVVESTTTVDQPSEGYGPVPAQQMLDANQKAQKRTSFVMPILHRKGWSTGDWANYAEVDFNTASGYLRGATDPYTSTRLKLAKALDVSIDHLPE